MSKLDNISGSNYGKGFSESFSRPLSDMSFEKLRTLLDQVSCEIASKFGLRDPNGNPRKATIIDAIANSACVGCITRKLSNNVRFRRIDALYKECHQLAVNILVEELYDMLNGMGYTVSISSEAKMEYGRADVLIKLTNYGVNLHYGANGLLIEVKTGFSLSLSQLFRYLLDERGRTLVVWRVRRRQVLVFDGNELKPLLMEFMKTCIMRGARLLASSEPTSCEHLNQHNRWSPTQKELQEFLQDFAATLVETMPHVVEIVIEKLGIKVNVLKSRQSCAT